MPCVADAILKSFFSSAGTRKFSATCLVGSGLAKLPLVESLAGGSPFLLFGGGGVLTGMDFPRVFRESVDNALGHFLRPQSKGLMPDLA